MNRAAAGAGAAASAPSKAESGGQQMEVDLPEPAAAPPQRLKAAPALAKRLGSTAPPADPPPVSVLITHLAHSVTEHDVQELCAAAPNLVSARLVEPGTAAAHYRHACDAQALVDLYDRRELDGVPMRVHIVDARRPSANTSSSSAAAAQRERQPVATPTAASGESAKAPASADDGSLPALRMKVKKSDKSHVPLTDLDRDTITAALFSKAGADGGDGERDSTQFTVKI